MFLTEFYTAIVNQCSWPIYHVDFVINSMSCTILTAQNVLKRVYQSTTQPIISSI
jgi:hypothetical protein